MTKMLKLISLTAVVAVLVASPPAFAKHGADDPAGHHHGGHHGTQHR